MPNLSVNGINIHVQRLGGGTQKVIFIHGLIMDNLSSWYFTVANKVALTNEVILYDLRGHGMSERPLSGYRVQDFTYELRSLIDALEIQEPVCLIGASFGGLLAISFAVAYPDLVKNIVLIDGHVSIEGWSRDMTATLALQGEERDRKIAETFKYWVGRHSRRKSSHLSKTALDLVYGTSLVDDLNASGALTGKDLESLHMPVLGLYGEGSDIRHLGEHLAGLLPHFTLKLFPGCTHSVFWEANAQVEDAILLWLSDDKN